MVGRQDQLAERAGGPLPVLITQDIASSAACRQHIMVIKKPDGYLHCRPVRLTPDVVAFGGGLVAA
jgi:hypothetical protein